MIMAVPLCVESAHKSIQEVKYSHVDPLPVSVNVGLSYYCSCTV